MPLRFVGVSCVLDPAVRASRSNLVLLLSTLGLDLSNFRSISMVFLGFLFDGDSFPDGKGRGEGEEADQVFAENPALCGESGITPYVRVGGGRLYVCAP